MSTYDQMMVDNRYPGDFDNEKYSFSKQQPPISNQDEDGNGSQGGQGRRVYLESPSFGNKEEEDLYRYVPSRVTDRTSSMIGTTLPAPTGATLMDSLDFDLDILGTNNAHAETLYRQPSKQPLPTRQLSNMPRADPRQDPLLGPLLAELDTMSNQQQQHQQQRQLPVSPPSNYRRNSVPYQPNLVRPIGSSPSNHGLTNIANRTVNDALLDTESYNPLNHPVSTLNPNSLHYSRPTHMDSSDIFMPSSYTTGPGTFLSHFGPEDQLFQRPLLNTLGQNYVPNPRPLQQQRDSLFDQPQTRISPTQRTIYPPPRNYLLEQQPAPPPPPLPPPNPFIEYQRAPPQQRYDDKNPLNNQDLFFTDHNEDQFEQQQQAQLSQRNSEQQEQDSRRQAVWNELQRSNAKVQEKNSKKHESATRNRAPFGSSLNLNQSGSQRSSALSKSPQRPFHHPPPISRPNHIEENIDMIRNKENFYHRYPARKYENAFSKRKDLQTESIYDKQEHEPKILSPPTNPQRHASLPVTVNLNTGENPQSGVLPATVTIPLDSHINRVGDKISVNIDLRLVDLQNLQQQQQQQQGIDYPQWAGGDPLDRHIRKLERNIEQSLPVTHPPQRSPVMPMASTNPSLGRYAKQPAGGNRGGYNPPVYGGGDYYNYSDKNRDEDSYLAKLNYSKRNTQFKPYTVRDYEQFKKNYGFGTGHLGYDFDNTTHKEKSDTLAKTRQYAQQIEARNKKKISGTSRRTLSDTRLPKVSRPFEYRSSAIRPKQFSGKSTSSSPAILSEIVPFIPARRPTEVLYRPIPVQRAITKLPDIEPKEIIEQEKPTLNSPTAKRREGSDRPYQRRLSPPRNLPPTGNNISKRRPIRFDDVPSQQPPPTVNDEEKVMNVIRQELNERPLNPNEELLIVEE